MTYVDENDIKIQKLHFELLSKLPYAPDFAASDFLSVRRPEKYAHKEEL